MCLGPTLDFFRSQLVLLQVAQAPWLHYRSIGRSIMLTCALSRCAAACMLTYATVGCAA